MRLSYLEKVNQYPVRVIIRHTLDYKNKIATDLIEEEIVQLERGDVPYFFKFIGSGELYYFKEKNSFVACQNLNERARKKMELIGRPFDELLNPERILNSLRPNAALQFLRYIQKDLDINELNSPIMNYKSADGKIILSLGEQHYQTNVLKG